MSACTCPKEMYNGYEPFTHLEGCPYGKWQAENLETIKITAQGLANRIHRSNRQGDEHLSVHSCGCLHLARYYLGLDGKLGLFWPDKDGKNVYGDATTDEMG